jgi:ATP-dependent DNA ligase
LLRHTVYVGLRGYKPAEQVRRETARNALLLGYYTDDGKLTYAGRVGTGTPVKVLSDLRRRLDPLARKTSPLGIPPPRSPRFGSSRRSLSPRSLI